MNLGSKKIPPSRQGKKQLIAFLKPNQITAALKKANNDRKTNQEIIGEAINAVFVAHGVMPPIKGGHTRIIRRNNGQAQIRRGEDTPECRSGRKSFGGWFDDSVFQQVNKFSSELNISVQSIIETGIYMITGTAPADDENWFTKLQQMDTEETPAN